jgi:hypothetical protein
MNEAKTRAEHIDLSDNGLVCGLTGVRRKRIYEYTPNLQN